MSTNSLSDTLPRSSWGGEPQLLLEHLCAVELQLDGRRVFLFLDYDGTLTPIVSNPREAHLSTGARELLEELSHYYTIGIVTGRSMTTVKNFVKIEPTEKRKFVYATSHGFNIDCGGKTEIRHQVGQQHLPNLKAAARRIEEGLRGVTGFEIEDNDFSVSVHYRNCLDAEVKRIEDVVENILSEYDDLKKGLGKKVFELRINVDWDKGKAILWLLEAMGISTDDDKVIVIYMGDDVTDEDAFRALKECRHGIGVLVSSQPRATLANYRVPEPTDVHTVLQHLLEYAAKNGHAR